MSGSAPHAARAQQRLDELRARLDRERLPFRPHLSPSKSNRRRMTGNVFEELYAKARQAQEQRQKQEQAERPQSAVSPSHTGAPNGARRPQTAGHVRPVFGRLHAEAAARKSRLAEAKTPHRADGAIPFTPKLSAQTERCAAPTTMGRLQYDTAAKDVQETVALEPRSTTVSGWERQTVGTLSLLLFKPFSPYRARSQLDRREESRA